MFRSKTIIKPINDDLEAILMNNEVEKVMKIKGNKYGFNRYNVKLNTYAKNNPNINGYIFRHPYGSIKIYRDERIEFYNEGNLTDIVPLEEGHIYFIGRWPMPISLSNLIGNYISEKLFKKQTIRYNAVVIDYNTSDSKIEIMKLNAEVPSIHRIEFAIEKYKNVLNILRWPTEKERKTQSMSSPRTASIPIIRF